MFPNPEISRHVISTLMSNMYPDRIPVGIVVNDLVLGGNARSVLHLIKALDCRLFHRLGVAAIERRIDAAIEEELLLASVICQYAPDLWDKYKDKIVVYRGCFPPIKCNSGISVFVSNSSSSYIKDLAARSESLVDHWVAVSSNAASILPKPESTTIITNCVDLHRCRQVLGRNEIRKRWGISDGQIVVGYVGRVVDDGCKVIDVIAAATAVLGDRYIPVFVGPVSWTDKDRLRSINKRCIFVKECHHIGDILAAIDCFVLVSRCEGCSLALMEAWAAGIPTVATAVGGVPYFSEKYGELSVIVNPSCGAEELSRAIVTALSDKNRDRILRAKEVICANYNLDEYRRRWTEYLTAIAHGSVAPNQPVPISETPVSVVVSVYNTDPTYLHECYASISKQTWPYWELIFVDDGSSKQQTLNKLHEIAGSDKRVRLILSPNHVGVSAARNIGLAEAKHDLVAVIDSDDIADPKWLARMVAAMKANPDVDICGCQLRAFDNNTRKTLYVSNHPDGLPSYSYILSEVSNDRLWFMNHSGSIYRRKKIISIGGYDESLNNCVDLDLWLRAFKRGFKFYNIPDVLLGCRTNVEGSLSQSTDRIDTVYKLRRRIVEYLTTKNIINSCFDSGVKKL